MKKKKERIYKKLPPSKLYISDVKKIVDILNQLSDRIKIETEEFELESVDELNDLEDEYLYNFGISCYDPYIKIEMRRHGIDIFAEGDLETKGAVTKILEIFSKRKRLTRIFESNWYFVIQIIVPVIVGVLASIFIPKPYSIYVFISLLSIFLVSSLILGYYSVKKYTIIVLKAKKEDSFWKRNKDLVIISLVCTTAGTLLAMILFKIFFG